MKIFTRANGSESDKKTLCAGRWPNVVAIGVILLLAASSPAQTCNDGCDDSNTYQGNDALIHLTTGSQDTAFGAYALTNNTGGGNNTAIGANAMLVNMRSSDNTAVGFNSLYNTNRGAHDPDLLGSYNTGVGSLTLFGNRSGYQNSAFGYQALYSNSDGAENTATGVRALYRNTSGGSNTASGARALHDNTTGSSNTATGTLALNHNTTGIGNTASGVQALYFNTTGYENAAIGNQALYFNSTGFENVASGDSALFFNSTGSSNTAIGPGALFNNTTGTSNIAIGAGAGSLLTTGSNNIEIGHEGTAAETNTIRIGRKGVQTQTFIAGITGQTVAAGIAVVIDADGRLGTITSSARFKEKIEPVGEASEAILSLEPVSFRYKKELDAAGVPQFGLVAEEVAKVDRDLVAFDDQGRPYTVRYEAVNAMLLNEFLKQHRRVEELEKTVAELRTVAAKQSELAATVAKLESALHFQAERLEKVSARIEANFPAALSVANQYAQAH